MVNLTLSRIPGDRNLYALEGVGTLRLEGPFSRRATAEAAGNSWHIARRGGTVRWGDRELALRRASMWRERYALADGDHEVALLDAKGWGRRPVTITVEDPDELDPGLLLYSAFIVHTLAGDTDAGAAAATTAATTSTG